MKVLVCVFVCFSVPCCVVVSIVCLFPGFAACMRCSVSVLLSYAPRDTFTHAHTRTHTKQQKHRQKSAIPCDSARGCGRGAVRQLHRPLFEPTSAKSTIDAKQEVLLSVQQVCSCCRTVTVPIHNTTVVRFSSLTLLLCVVLCLVSCHNQPVFETFVCSFMCSSRFFLS